MAEAARWPARWTPVAVALIVLLGLALRLDLARDINRAQPDTPARLTADEPGYDNLARGLLDGYGLTWPGRVPLYPAWVAALHALTGYSYAKAIYIQSFVGALAVWLTFLLGRDRFGPRAGLLAALGAAVHLALIRQSVRILSEILFTPAVLAVAISFSRALDAPTMARFAWAGAWIGLANLIRPTLVGFPIFAALTVAYVWRRRRDTPARDPWRHAAALVLVSLLVVTPWVVRNYLKYGAVYPLATSNAILWQGSPEYFHLIRHRGYTYLDVWNKVIYGPEGEGHDAGSVEGDRYWTRRALRSIAAEPLLYARFCAEKAVTYWIGDPNADWGDTFVFNFRVYRSFGYSRWETLQYMLVRVFPIVAFACLIALGPERRRVTAVTSILAYCTLLHALTHAEARLSEPLHPLLLVVTAGAVLRWWSPDQLDDSRPCRGPAASSVHRPTANP